MGSHLRMTDYFVSPIEALAAARRQAGHRQSSPSAGIGSFAVSSMHQQCPDRSQVKAVPQRGQVRGRCAAAAGEAFSGRFVMKRSGK